MKLLLIISGSLVVGLVLEGLRLSGNAKKFLKTTIKALILSLSVFLIGVAKKGWTNEIRLKIWPLFFFIWLIIFIANDFKKQIRPRLGEGITLISTISFLYFLEVVFGSTPFSPITRIAYLPSLVTFLCAFTSWDLNRNMRLILSVWNTIINSFFGVFLVVSVLRMAGQFEAVQTLNHPMTLFLFCLEYAMLGAASIHIFYNLYLLFGYLPSKQHFFDKQYFRETEKLTEEHISLYSTVQIKPSHALTATVLHGGPLLANHFFQFATPHFMFWYSLSISPLIVNFVLRLISHEEKVTV